MTARNTWKGYERRVAAALGGQRIPVTGIDRDGADVITPMFDVQVKLRANLPDWLWAWLGGIQATAKASGRIGILVLRKPRQKDCDALVVLSWSDWQDLHGRLSESVEQRLARVNPGVPVDYQLAVLSQGKP